VSKQIANGTCCRRIAILAVRDARVDGVVDMPSLLEVRQRSTAARRMRTMKTPVIVQSARGGPTITTTEKPGRGDLEIEAEGSTRG